MCAPRTAHGVSPHTFGPSGPQESTTSAGTLASTTRLCAAYSMRSRILAWIGHGFQVGGAAAGRRTGACARSSSRACLHVAYFCAYRTSRCSLYLVCVILNLAFPTGDHDVAVIGDKKYGWTAGRGIMRDRLLSWFPGNQLYVHTFYHLIDSVEATIGRFFAVKVRVFAVSPAACCHVCLFMAQKAGVLFTNPGRHIHRSQLLPWPLKALLRGVLRAPFYALSDSTLSKVTGKLTRGNKTFAAVLSYLGGARRRSRAQANSFWRSHCSPPREG